MRTARRWLAMHSLLLALGLTGCATTVTYVPTEDNVHMSVFKARRVLAASGITVMDNKTVRFGRFGGADAFSLPLKDLRVSAGVEGSMYGNSSVIVLPDSGYDRIRMDWWGWSHVQIAEALFVVKRQAEKEGFVPQEPIEDARFERAVQEYLASASKPMLGEEARSFKVQAEDAVKNKRFEDAADLYYEALQIAPWWPEGHFNRALILGDLKEFDAAVFEMKRYLRLAPDAANARAAQDKMYVWQAEAKRTGRRQ